MGLARGKNALMWVMGDVGLALRGGFCSGRPGRPGRLGLSKKASAGAGGLELLKKPRAGGQSGWIH
jgi:hypothetical protein